MSDSWASGMIGAKPTRRQKEAVLNLIDWKLRGDKRKEALRIVLNGRVSERAVLRMIATLEAMPDRDDGNARAILRPEQVAEMRRLRETEGLTYQALADRFGVSHSTAHQAVTGGTWKPRPEAKP